MTGLLPEPASETAIALIACHGGDPARWPEAQRAAVLALAAADADVAAALAAAQQTDAALADWLAAPLPVLAGVDVAAITAISPERAPTVAAPVWQRWRPAMMAASVAGGLLAAGWLALPALPAGAPQTKMVLLPAPSIAVTGEADLAFAYVFTPTATEEELI